MRGGAEGEPLNRFQFRLARVEQYRLREFEAANEVLHRLIRERDSLREAKETLRGQYLAEEEALRAASVPRPSDHEALTYYRRHVLAEQAKLDARIQDWERRVEKQRAEVMEARRRHRLLNRLHEKRKAEWDTAFARETDSLAEESHLARWNPNGQGGRQPERPDPYL